MNLKSPVGEDFPEEILQADCHFCQGKGELGVAQCELSGKDSDKTDGPGEKQLVRRELHLFSCCWNINCGTETGEN